MSGDTSETARASASPCVITIDLGALARNWRAIAALVAPAECAAVVKADAYGVGVAGAVPALSSAGCHTFFVATFEEAARVRALAPEAVIYVLDGPSAGGAAQFRSLGVRPVLSSLGDVRDWAAVSHDRGPRLGAALQVESGMNRLGLDRSEVDALVGEPSLLSRFETTLVMSHLASAELPGAAQNASQHRAFLTAASRFSEVPRSLAASGGILLGPSYHFDLVRPGYVLYGGQPSEGRAAPVEPVVRVEARVLQVRDVEGGEAVGYGGAWVAPGRSRIATIACGYADGLARASGAPSAIKGGAIAFRGIRAPIVGRVSMDLVTADVTELGAAAPRRGDLVELIGPTISLEDAGRASGTIGYEVLTRLSRRATRIYLDPASEGGNRHGQG